MPTGTVVELTRTHSRNTQLLARLTAIITDGLPLSVKPGSQLFSKASYLLLIASARQHQNVETATRTASATQTRLSS